MIITESDLDSKTAQSDIESRSVAGSSTPAPPAYQPDPTNATHIPLYLPPTQPLVEPKSREPTWKRFLKAFLVAAIIYILLAILVGSFVDLAERHLVEGLPAGPSKEDGHIVDCANDTWGFQTAQKPFTASDFPPYSVKASFKLPVSSSLHFLLSRGSYGRGSIKFELSDNSGDNIEVDTVMSYYNLAARRRAKVCHLERDEGGHGIGIFTPRRLHPSSPGTADMITVDITVRFPKLSSQKHPLVVNALETDMSMWSHRISGLEDRVTFKSLSLKASNSMIRSDSISADFAKITTSNSPITGSFNVSDSLSLVTSNAFITAKIRLENRDGHQPTKLEMKTSNGRIETPVTLVSTDPSSSPSPAAFSVTARTSNQPLALTFPDAPSSPFSHLTISGRTSNAQANVKLHPTYEGTLSLSTSNEKSSIVQKSNPTDPSGKGRHRNAHVEKVRYGVLTASVWWGNDTIDGEGQGSVVVTTSNAKNVVELS